MTPRPISHLLHAWPADAGPKDTASVVVHVRRPEQLLREIAELKASGLAKVLVVTAGGKARTWWA
jgi:hypothetical protein